MLTVIDETTRESLAIEVGRRFRADDVLRTLTRLFVERGPPAFIRSEYGPEFTATAVRIWLARLGVGVLFIAPGWFGIGFPQDAPSLEARLSEEIKAAIDNPQHHQLRKPLTFSYAVK